MKMKFFLTITIILFCTNTFSTIENISVCFKQNTINPNESTITEGKIYSIIDEKKIYLKTDIPITQYMIISENDTFIYYPNDNKAFHYSSTFENALPFFQVFINLANNNEINYSNIGFEIEKNIVDNDTLITIWKQSNKSKKSSLGNIQVGLYEDRLEFIRIMNKKKKIISAMNFDNYISYEGKTFPLKIMITQYFKERVSSYEIITYEKLEINTDFDSELEIFSIPESTIIEEIKW